MNNTFIAPADKEILQQAGLSTFESLWNIQLETVDEPNTERGGLSQVSRLEIGGRPYFLKRQVNHLTCTVSAPFGEPTFAYEFRNIRRYKQLNIPTLDVAFFGVRHQGNDKQAILLTHELTGWTDLTTYLAQWDQLQPETSHAIISSCGKLLKRLHHHKILHGCFYPKHIFLKQNNEQFETCLIDLEKSRRLWNFNGDRVKDIETLIRRVKHYWSEHQHREFLSAYLNKPINSDEVTTWLAKVYKRNKHKEARS